MSKEVLVKGKGAILWWRGCNFRFNWKRETSAGTQATAIKA